MTATPEPGGACLRIAAWSGPRNISTAMMRAWENRPDTVVIDEPFYASYLARTGLPHPGRDEVLASQPVDWRVVAERLVSDTPTRASVVYQKQMAHHVFPDMHGPWLDAMTHVFLIRDPASMILSLDKVTPDPGIEDTGLPQQLALFERVAASAAPPPVLDAGDVLAAPAAMLSALCAALGVPFTERMLRWRPGPRSADGVWAPHWYARVWRSTGFESPTPRSDALPARLEPLLAACRPIYETLYASRIRA